METNTKTPRTAPDRTDDTAELERYVLGALILEKDLIPEALRIIGPDAFTVDVNARIYAEMSAMFDEGKTVDLVTLATRPNLAGRDNARYLAALTAGIGGGMNCTEYVRTLRARHTKRRLSAFGNELAGRAGNAFANADEVMKWACGKLDGIMAGVVSDEGPQHWGTMLDAALQAADERQRLQREGRPVGITSGLRDLDVVTGGWCGGQLIVIGGRPAMGKSAVMLKFAKEAAKQGIPVCIYSLEMSAKELCDRLLLDGCDVGKDSYRAGDLSEGDWKQLDETAVELKSLPIHIDATPGRSIRQIRAHCALLRNRGKCGMVIIDYLQLMEMGTTNRSITRERQVAETTRAAKMLAKELSVPVILLSQLSRDVENRADRTPLLSDLRESGAIEQDADVVIFIDRPEVYGYEVLETRFGRLSTNGLGRLIIAKHRNGGTGTVYFRHRRDLTHITDCDTPPSTPAGRQNDPF